MFGSTWTSVGAFRAARAPRSQPLNLSHRQAASRRALRIAHPQLRIGTANKRSPVPGGQLPFFDPVLNRRLQLQQPNRVRYRSAVFSGTFRHRFLRKLKFVHQPFKRPRCFDGIQVFALDVFDQRHFERQLVGHLPDDRRNLASVPRAAPLATGVLRRSVESDSPIGRTTKG